MKQIYLIIINIALAGATLQLSAQNEPKVNTNATTYQVKLFGSAATGENTPFWMVSNRYGVVPLEAGNGYLQAVVSHNQSFGKGFRWNAGLDVVAAMPRYHNVFIQQLFAEIGYKCLLLSVGSKERYSSLLDKNLSSGDAILSTNARPIPEVNISIPTFTVIPGSKGWLQVKGEFAVGRSFDSGYLEHFANEKQTYIKHVMWHHKSLFIQVKDTRNNSPLSGTLGVQHIAQWGGTSTNPKIGKQPASLKDFIRIVSGSKGGSNATASDQVNVLGSHHISYDFHLSYTQKDWALHGYHQHLCFDKSGLVLQNGMDGLWGMELDLPRLPWLSKVVAEYFTTMNASGPFHFIDFDHATHPGRGGGGDDYYNNGEYLSGNSYFNRGTGSPLIPAPEYNTDGSLGFRNNRVRDWHFGAEGAISPQVSYRFLLSVMNTWGTTNRPFLDRKDGVSCAADIRYQHPRLKGWEFTGSVAADTGSLFGDNLGFSLGVAKRGVLKY
ncbi:MAG: capsule assembly Wzi family protein [Tannerellaceae bacterium]